MVCGRCKLPLTWEATMSGNDTNVEVSIAYRTVNDYSQICEQDTLERHIVKVPTAVKALVEFTRWLNAQVEEDSVEREYSIS